MTGVLATGLCPYRLGDKVTLPDADGQPVTGTVVLYTAMRDGGWKVGLQTSTCIRHGIAKGRSNAV